MKIIRPLIIFLTLISMAATLYGQKATENNPQRKSNVEVKLNVEDDLNPVKIFPNPTTEYLNIDLNNADLKKVSFELYDIIGNKIEIQPQELDEGSYRIPVEKLHMGYYVLIISDSYSRYKKAFKFSKR